MSGRGPASGAMAPGLSPNVKPNPAADPNSYYQAANPPQTGANTPSSGGGMGGGGGGGFGNYGPSPVGTYAKGGSVKSCSYAQGGPVTGRSRSFVKGDNEFTTGKGVPQNYGKKGK